MYITEQTSLGFDLGTYLNNCSRNIKKVNSNLDKYLHDPNEENIHNVRTSIRRLEGSFTTSPKQIRNKKRMEKRMSKSKQFFSSNSQVRDIDIILEKIKEDGKATQQQYAIFEKMLNDDKKEQLDNAYALAGKLSKKKFPQLYSKKAYNSKKTRKRIIKRISTAIDKYISRINMMIPTVINDSSKIEDLHKLRKDSKKLRYIFELLIGKEKKYKEANENGSADGNDKYTKFILQCIEKLEEIQNTIGQIHDYDITLEYLRQQEEDPSIIKPMVNNIEIKRNKKFKDFVNYCKVDLLSGNSILKEIESINLY